MPPDPHQIRYCHQVRRHKRQMRCCHAHRQNRRNTPQKQNRTNWQPHIRKRILSRRLLLNQLPTTACKLIPADLAIAPYTQRCEALVDAAADTRTDAVAARGGGTRADVIAVVKALYCERSDSRLPNCRNTYRRVGLRTIVFHSEPCFADNGGGLTDIGDIAAHWSTYGDNVPCHDAGLLVNAHNAMTTGPTFSKVLYC